MSKKKKNHVSPVGKAVWPKLSEPDTKFNPEGVYETLLRLEPEEGQKFLSHLDAMLDEHHQSVCEEQGKTVKRADIPHKMVDVDGERTGEIDFKFKLKALAGKPGNQWDQRPSLFDAKGTPINPKEISVGSGSKIKVSYTVFPYYTAMVGAGLSLQLQAVQILDLVEYGGSDAKGFGFSEEDGYKSAEEAKETSNASTNDDDDGDF